MKTKRGRGVANLTWVERGEIEERPGVIMDGDRDQGGRNTRGRAAAENLTSNLEKKSEKVKK